MTDQKSESVHPEVTKEVIGSGTYGTIHSTKNRDMVFKKWQEHYIPHDLIIEYIAAARLTRNQHKPLGITLNPLGIYYPRYEIDLFKLLRQRALNPIEIRTIVKQCLQIIQEAHALGMTHRDLKSPNILIQGSGEDMRISICDWGLTRFYEGDISFNVQTVWWRAPEILLGDVGYSTKVDIWSLGMIFTELYTQKVFMQGANEYDQLKLVCRLSGVPDETSLKTLNDLPGYQHLRKIQRWPDKCSRLSWKALAKDQNLLTSTPEVVALIQRMLLFDPQQRPTCTEALAFLSTFGKPQKLPASSFPPRAFPSKSTLSFPKIPPLDYLRITQYSHDIDEILRFIIDIAKTSLLNISIVFRTWTYWMMRNDLKIITREEAVACLLIACAVEGINIEDSLVTYSKCKLRDVNVQLIKYLSNQESLHVYTTYDYLIEHHLVPRYEIKIGGRAQSLIKFPMKYLQMLMDWQIFWWHYQKHLTPNHVKDQVLREILTQACLGNPLWIPPSYPNPILLKDLFAYFTIWKVCPTNLDGTVCNTKVLRLPRPLKNAERS